MYIAPSSGHISLNLNMPFKLILRRFEVFFFYVWSENAALFERLMGIHSNPPILYYGFKNSVKLWSCRPYICIGIIMSLCWRKSRILLNISSDLAISWSAWWGKVNVITVTRRTHHPSIAAGLCCLATSPGLLPALCEKWSGFCHVHRVLHSYTLTDCLCKWYIGMLSVSL